MSESDVCTSAEALASIRANMAVRLPSFVEALANDNLPLAGLAPQHRPVRALGQEEAGDPTDWFFIGDLHGDFHALHTYLNEAGRLAPGRAKILFLGDIIDRGLHPTECLFLLLDWAQANPGRLTWLAGNHDVAIHRTAEGVFASEVAPAEFLMVLNGEDAHGISGASLGEFFMALTFLERAVPIMESSLGENNEETANAFFTLGTLLVSTGDPSDFDAGVVLLQRELAVMNELYGHESIQVAESLSFMADTLVANDKLGEAIPLRRERLDILESIYGDADNEDLAITLHSLAVEMRNAGQIEEALPLQQRAVNMINNVFGSESEESTNPNSALGWLYHLLGDDVAARSYLEKALEVRRNLYGDDDEKTLKIVERLAAIEGRSD